MKKTGWIIAGVTGLTLLGIYLKKQYDLSQQVFYSAKDFRLSNLSGSRATATFNLVVENRGQLEVVVNRLKVDVYINDTFVGTVDKQTAFKIMPNTTMEVPATFTFSPKYIFKNLTNFLSGNLDATRVTFKGKAVAKKLGIGFPIPFKFTETIGNLK